MNGRRILLLLLLMAGQFLFSCKKDEIQEPGEEISIIPSIALEAVSPSSIQQFDSLIFTIRYTDGDGDLGFEDADSLSLFITDMRFPVTQGFHIPPLSPEGTSVAITGTLITTLENIILQNSSSSSESAQFSVQLKDRQGNLSNLVISPAITILP